MKGDCSNRSQPRDNTISLPANILPHRHMSLKLISLEFFSYPPSDNIIRKPKLAAGAEERQDFVTQFVYCGGQS